MQSGLVPYHLVRRPLPRTSPKSKPYEALVKAITLLHSQDVGSTASAKPEDLLARLQPRGTSNYDLLVSSRVPKSRIDDVYDDKSSSFFAVGYGATRRVEAGEEDSGSRAKRRTLRYQRVAGLFEDHVALRPLERWLPALNGIVLVDEIDLHLHPQWQRLVVPTVSKTFPNLQCVFSTHSPIVAGTLSSRNIRVLETSDDGSTEVKQFGDRIPPTTRGI
jgi:hypothetical protein